MVLATQHYAMLHGDSAIAEALIATRGYQTLTDPGDLRDLGFSKAQARTAPGLLIPLWNIHGERMGWQFRPDAPRLSAKGTEIKYENPAGSQLTLDIHPTMQPLLKDPTIPLWITEGVKKGDAMASQGACTIALMGGVWGFKGTNQYGGKNVILPDWQYVPLNDRLVYVVYDSDIYRKPEVDKALKALNEFLRGRQAQPRRVEWPQDMREHKVGVDDFLASGHTLDDVMAMVPPTRHLPPRQPRAAPVQAGDEAYPYSDAYNAQQLVRAHGVNLRYCAPWRSWLTWSGRHWQRDTVGLVIRWQRETVQALGAQLPGLDVDATKALLGHIKSSLNTSRLEAAVKQAYTWEGVSIDHSSLDSSPWLLNCSNGTLDLRTGTLRPHDRADLLTKCLDIPYEADATCEAWDTFLWRIMGGSQRPDNAHMMSAEDLAKRHEADVRAHALVAFLQRAIGYTLTGSTQEQCLFILHGVTKTGKSTFLATLRNLLGPYGQQADMESFMHKDRAEVRNDLADLAGARFVCALEAQEGRRLAESLIKQMTGGSDVLKARFLYEEHFTFKPQFKIFLGTNHKPVIKDTDDAIWERLRLVPFTVQIPEAERDPDLEERLRDELPGILAWAVQGCLAWQRHKGLQAPSAVKKATKDYREEMDTLGAFLQECCVVLDSATVKSTKLANAYQHWCKETTSPNLSNSGFIAAMEQRGFIRDRGHANQYYWHGLGLADTSDDTH
jgi:putative DNA primase/helicase